MKREISFPKRIKFFISFKCNFQCPYCYLPEDFFERDKENIENLCEKLREYEVREIEILGGEPFLNPERIEYFLNFCLSSKIYLRSISTNGQSIKKEILELLKKFKDLTVQVSLDAATPKTYKIMRNSSHFARVINNIRLFKENKIRTLLSFVANKKTGKN
jgi:MoaA/NifB/PqqE/SkfB family radical SAM enzyme